MQDTTAAAIKSFFTNPTVILALVLPSIAVTASFFTFVYELGYCFFFAIPPDYISLTSARASLLGVALAVVLAFFIPITAVPILIGTINRTFFYFVISFLSYALFLLITESIIVYRYTNMTARDLISWNLFLLVWMFGISWFARSLLRRWSKTPIAEKEPTWWRYSSYSIWIFMAWFGFAVAFFWAGYDTARVTTLFQVISKDSNGTKQEIVVLRIYGDYLITAPIVQEDGNNQIRSELYILKLSEMSETPLAYKNVGPLKVKQEDL